MSKREPAVGPVQVDEDVDGVADDARRRIGIGDLVEIDEAVERSREARTQRPHLADAERIAEDLEARAIVPRHHLRHEPADRVVAEVGGEIADPQSPPLGRSRRAPGSADVVFRHGGARVGELLLGRRGDGHQHDHEIGALADEAADGAGVLLGVGPVAQVAVHPWSARYAPLASSDRGAAPRRRHPRHRRIATARSRSSRCWRGRPRSSAAGRPVRAGTSSALSASPRICRTTPRLLTIGADSGASSAALMQRSAATSRSLSMLCIALRMPRLDSAAASPGRSRTTSAKQAIDSSMRPRCFSASALAVHSSGIGRRVRQQPVVDRHRLDATPAALQRDGEVSAQIGPLRMACEDHLERPGGRGEIAELLLRGRQIDPRVEMIGDTTQRFAAGHDGLRATPGLVQDRRQVRPDHRLRRIDGEKLAVDGLGARVIVALMVRERRLKQGGQGGARDGPLDAGLTTMLGPGHAGWRCRCGGCPTDRALTLEKD